MQVFIAGWTLASENIPWIGLLHYVYQIKKFGSPLNYFGDWLLGIILEGQAQETKQANQCSPAQSAAWHFDFDLLTTVLAVWFDLARQILFPMEYVWVFCWTNLLSLDELQVNGEGDGNTEMLGLSDICNDNNDIEVVIEANSDHSLGEYSARCSKSGKSDCIF
jgi:hypothetical protein